MRVYELARELGTDSKALLAKLHDLGVEAKSHMSALDDTAIELLREERGAEPAAAPAQEAAAAAEGEQPAAAPAVPAAPEPPSAPAPAPAPAGADEKTIRLRGTVVVRELAEMLGLRPNQLVAELMRLNVLASINERLDFGTARKVGEKLGFTVEQERRSTEHQAPQARARAEAEEPEAEDREEDLLPRPPVVTFLGHVDHGKTSLLDRIRDTAVTQQESGGITQHIGAYTLDVDGRPITFLDTPGHEAFTAMRARGANLTDIAVIVIAADDGVMPQTREAIAHARAADVAMLAAVNKIDLPGANPSQAYQQLQADGLAPEAWGGDLICCEVSAQTGEGIEHLLEMILLQAELLELRANPKRRARGYVIEAQMEQGMGPTATVLVTKGTLKVGDMMLTGAHFGRVRALINDHGVKVKSATPGMPVKCLGLSGVPEAGAAFRICANERVARAQAQERMQLQKEEQLSAPPKASLDSLYQQLEANEKLELKLILRADTRGSVEAIGESLKQIKSDKVSLNIFLSGTGNITTSDVMLASASNAVVVGFHVAKESGVDAMAKHEGVEIRLHQVIYELLAEVREAMTGLLAPKINEKIMGHAEIRQVFSISRGGKVAGCLVTDGTVSARSRVRLKRGSDVLYEGSIQTLRHFQDEVAQVRESQECGIRLDRHTDLREGDVLEAYELEEVEQTL